MKSLFILSMLITSTAIFAQENVEIKLLGKKYGIPSGHVQVTNPMIDISNEKAYLISGDKDSAEVVCDLLDMELVNYMFTYPDSAVQAISFNEKKDMIRDKYVVRLLGLVHCQKKSNQ